MTGRAWWIALAALLLVIGGLVGWGTRAALGAPSLADPSEYLARHGLSAPPTPFALVPADDPYLVAARAAYGPVAALHSRPGGTCIPDGTPAAEPCSAGDLYMPEGIRVAEGQAAVDLIVVALHEWGHAVSNADGTGYSRAFMRQVEEGLVEAWTLHHAPGWARYLLGRSLRPHVIAEVRETLSYAEAGRWLRAAMAATGGSRWSRAVREQLGAWLGTSLEERVGLLERWT